ncbi:MAG: hypothetical protein QM817_38155 [Archangium sp.]
MKSNARPWLRGAFVGLVPLFLPFVWVVELDSCGTVPTQTEFTGLQLVSKFEPEFWALLIPVLAIAIAMPLIAARLIVPVHRLLFQVIGAIAAGFSTYLGLMMLFLAIFVERRAHGAGWVVVALWCGVTLDALYRVYFSLQEWRASRGAPP